MSRKYDGDKPLCIHNEGVWCSLTSCKVHCGWRPSEEDRRKRRIRRYGLSPIGDGARGLKLVREADIFGDR